MADEPTLISSSGGPKIGGGDLDLSIRPGFDFEPDLPASIEFPTVKGPCGFPIPQVPGIPLPKVSLKDAITLGLGVPIPEVELPTVCPELLEAALVAAVLAYEAARK